LDRHLKNQCCPQTRSIVASSPLKYCCARTSGSSESAPAMTSIDSSLQRERARSTMQHAMMRVTSYSFSHGAEVPVDVPAPYVHRGSAALLLAIDFKENNSLGVSKVLLGAVTCRCDRNSHEQFYFLL
jgi:hypothetical protein